MANTQQDQNRRLESIKLYMTWYNDTQDHPMTFTDSNVVINPKKINKIVNTIPSWGPRLIYIQEAP